MIEKVDGNKEFPKLAMGVFILTMITIAVYEMLTLDADLSAREETVVLVAGGVVGSIGGIIGGLIGISIQYVFIKYPTQWLTKEEFVYKNEIWEAIFYSSTAGFLINFLLIQFGLPANLLVSTIVSILTTGLFLLIYFSGREKEPHIKRAITIVQIAWIVIGFGLGFVLNLFADMAV